MSRSPHPVDAQVGARISFRRAALGLSQGGLAQRLGISAQQVQKYEAGTNRIAASRLVEIARLLGVSPTAFLPEADDPTPDLSERFAAGGLPDRVQVAFGRIADRRTRLAVTRIVEALAGPA